jgi:serine/threonine protein kinase
MSFGLQKIADFGLATQLSRADEKHLTMCGTPNYISPEVSTVTPKWREPMNFMNTVL